MDSTTIKNGKTMAIISHITFVGLIIAIIMNADKKNAFTAFYNRQMIGLIIMLFIAQITDKYLNGTIGYIFWLISAVSWLYSFIHIIQGKVKLLPYVGEKFQEWFANIGN
ncbi:MULTISPECIES: hypothetical protein [Aestuariibaculum]|uniref:Chloroplast import component protein (Tic20) n=1 Tax=Aestuariibaculum lutulentum TaxID=2920935 RepID=A0ABS9RKF9_9FLAO|nr:MULTISPECIES: hypothetical protein [Aestuariibaculum]MCH4552986.1 hypothetical protein [Aestuariibaculum lutulentum]MCR8669120.1 hypothetical protein [Aestuariibaculum sp. M13]